MSINNKYLKFLFEINKTKPNNIKNQDILCPFCNKENLSGILEHNDKFMLIKNKYPIFEDTFPTILIETDKCNEGICDYSKEYFRKLIRFGVRKLLEFENSKKFKSVIFYKNHGPKSGGSIKHSHMQIIGLKNIDYKENLKEEFFEGEIINKDSKCILNISTKPMVGFTEFNVIINDIKNIDSMSDNIKIIVHYILKNFYLKCNSYNLFFYHLQDRFICKIVPRFTTSPLYVGYNIPQISNQNSKVVNDIVSLYFT